MKHYRVAVWASALSLFFLASAWGAAADTNAPGYQIGDMVEEDVLTPVPLVVLSPEETKSRRESSALRVPTIYRFDSGVAERVDVDFRASFARAHGNFLVALERVYQKRKIEPGELLPQLERVIAQFRKKERNFPLVTNLFVLWAEGDAGESIQKEWLGRLQAAMGKYLHPSLNPPSANTSTRQAWVVPALTNDVLTLEMMEAEALTVARSNIFGMTRARAAFQKEYETEDEAITKYLISRLRPNSFFDEVATEEVRARKVKDIYATDLYAAGQVILKKGDRVDARGKAAWDELQLKTAADQVRAEAAEERARAHALLTRLAGKATSAQVGLQIVSEKNYRLWIGLAAMSVLAAVALVLSLKRRRVARSFLPVPLRPGLGAAMSSDALALPQVGGTDVLWKERALRAEESSEKTKAILRAGLLPELARWMMNKFVAILARDRKQLLASQQAALEDLAALDRRLTKLQTPLQERLLAYEKRIVELERQLTTREDENVELIKAQIALARQQLEAERAKEHVELN